jgi:cobalt-zinc-cadmium efflux system outer membrane protein
MPPAIRSISWLLLSWLLLAAALPVAAQGQPQPLRPPVDAAARAEIPPGPFESGWRRRLAAAVRRALAQNPRLQEVAARAEAARERAPQAAVLPDPEIEIGLRDAPVRGPSLSRDDFTMEMVTARQRLPGRGKRSAQRAAARAEVEGAAAAAVREAIEVAADTADAFFRLAESDRTLAILEDSRKRLEDAAAAATSLYQVGKAGQSDVLRANLETTRLDEKLSTLRAERRAQAARFNSLQGLPAAAPIEPIEPIGAVDPGSGIPAAGELARRGAEESPAVAAAAAEVRRAEQELELARLEGKPDWMLTAYYGHRFKFEDLAGVSAAIDLPWAHGRRLEERRAEKEADLAAARARVEAAKNEIRGEVEAAYAELAKNLEQARLYSDSILPQAEVNYRSARESYVVGKIDFLTLARAAVDLDTYRVEAAKRATGAGRALAALQRASGLPLIEGTPAAGGPDAHP